MTKPLHTPQRTWQAGRVTNEQSTSQNRAARRIAPGGGLFDLSAQAGDRVDRLVLGLGRGARLARLAFGDLSAGSGLNAFQRDEDHARAFIERHQDKLLYGSDCSDHMGTGPKCSGSQQIAMVRKLASPAVQRKLFWDNAARIIKLT